MSTAADLRGIVAIAPLIRDRRITPTSLVRACLDRIEARRELNAFITVMAETALEEARVAEREIAAGSYRGPLHGIPVSIKDLVDVAGTPTTSASAVPPRRPSADAPIVTRLREAGAIIIGKTNLHEFAFGTTSDETAFGPVRNPIDPARSAGGSSGGAAVALVEGMCFGSVGTDTGGSIRIPSAACGTVGLKPAAGELSCEGIVALSTTLDNVGPMTRNVADAAAMFRAMRGTSAGLDTAGLAWPWYEAAEGQNSAALRLAVPEKYFCDRLDPNVRAALNRTRETLRAAGHDVANVEIDFAACTPDVYLHIVLPEASWYHAAMLDAHAADYSPGVRLRLEMGRTILAEDYVRAMRLRDLLTHAVDRALAAYDALLLPAMPIVAPLLGEALVDVGGTREPVRAVMLRLTQLFNITGHPAIALPAGRTGDGLPIGMQLVGHRGGTERLLSLAAVVENYMTAGGSVGGGTG